MQQHFFPSVHNFTEMYDWKALTVMISLQQRLQQRTRNQKRRG